MTTEIDLMGRSMSKSFKYANTINAKRAIIIGEKELSQGAATVRDMNTGEQQLIKVDELLAVLER